MSGQPSDVHLWIAPMPSRLPETDMSVVLDADEKRRSSSLRVEGDRHNYIFTHFVLRNILSKYVALDPKGIRFIVGSFGKPTLANSGNGKLPEFSLSHSGSMVVVALCIDRPLGVDIERVRTFKEAEDIARDHFSPQEYSLIHQRPREERVLEFFRCWTRKESYIKAVGQGLSMPLDSFDTCLSQGSSGRWISRSFEMSLTEKWWLADIAVPDGYTGAITVSKGFDRLIYHKW